MTTIEKAISTYGADAQLNVAIEEFAELTKEICKHKRYADNRANIVEEMADCYIMLDQLSIIFGITFSEIDKEKDKKIARLEMRLAEGSNQ
jgi:hypothetical protein